MRIALHTLVIMGCAVIGCTGGSTFLEGERLAAGDGAFHQDPHWLGGDIAASIALDGDRTLWLFGDTFIATTPARTRRESAIVHNSIAVMTGDLATGTLAFEWHRDPIAGDFIGSDAGWLAPLGGVMTPGGLVLWFADVSGYGPEGVVVTRGTRAVRIVDPSGPPAAWSIEPLEVPASTGLIGGCTTIADDHVVALEVDHHAGRLVRWPLATIAVDQASREWWAGDAWSADESLATTVIADAVTQCWLGYDDQLTGDDGNYGVWLYAGQRGYSLDYRTAGRLEGPYGDPFPAYDPPNPEGTRAIHTRLHALSVDDAGSYAATYVDLGDPDDLLDPALEYQLYWPHVAKIWHGEAVE